MAEEASAESADQELEASLACILANGDVPHDAATANTALRSLVVATRVPYRQGSHAYDLLATHARHIRDTVVRVHAGNDAVQITALQLIARMKRLQERPLQMLFADDVRDMLMHPLGHTRACIKAALDMFVKQSPLYAAVFKTHPTLFIDLARLYDLRKDEDMVLCVLRTASLSRVTPAFADKHKDFLLSLFHKSDVLRRSVFLYVVSSSRFYKKKKSGGLLRYDGCILNDMAPLITDADAEYMREHSVLFARRFAL